MSDPFLKLQRFSVQNGGLGFEEGQIEKLFDRYRSLSGKILQIGTLDPIKPEFQRLSQADLEQSSEAFDVLICPFGEFQRKIDPPSIDRMLGAFKSLLKAGGKLIFDLSMPNLEDLTTDLCVFEPKEIGLEEGIQILVRGSGRYLSPEQIWHEKYRFAGDEPFFLERDLRVYFMAELLDWLERAGFSVSSISGDFDGGPVTCGSRNFFLEALRCA